MAREISYTFAPTALDADGVCASQTLAGAGDLTINGALASSGVATFGEQQRVTLYSTANYSLLTFTVYGTTANGAVISESLAGPNNSTVTTTSNFKTVTRIAASAALATAILAGNSNALETPWLRLNQYAPLKGIIVELSSGASLTYEVQYGTRVAQTDDGVAVAETAIVAVADATLTAKTATATTAATLPWPLIRVKVTSYASGSGVLRVAEARYS
jgi:hypothetical protein